MDFNFDALESVNRANPIKNRKQTWRLKRAQRSTGPTFIFSQSLFDELNMSSNSLDIMHDPGAVYLVVCNENDGKWARTSKKGKKGKGFKNEELAKLLDERSLTAEHLDVQSIGVNPTNNLAYYRIIAFEEDATVDATPTAEEPAMEMGSSSEPDVSEEAIADAGPETPVNDF